MKFFKYITIAIIAFSLLESCKKAIEIKSPVDEVATNNVFSDPSLLNEAVLNLYPALSSTLQNTVSSSWLSYYIDELVSISGATTASPSIYYSAIIPTTDATDATEWRLYYSLIYQSNAIINGLKNNAVINDSLKNRFTGEAEFCRAYAYFHLINIWGDVPLVLTTDVNATSHVSRTSLNTVYSQIVADLIDAKAKLLGSYIGEQKIRATKWAAAAFLARVYTFAKDWKNAESEANAVINSNVFSLQTNLNNVFLADNGESILELWNVNGYTIGSSFIPNSSTQVLSYTLSPSLVNNFTPGDNRKVNWIGTNVINGVTYNYLNKYKARTVTTGTNAEYFILLRLAEMYLIKAEAEENQNDISGAMTDLNFVHTRAGLTPINPNNLTQVQCDALVQQERRCELFLENDLRFFDLKRTNTLNSVMQPIKSNWKPYGNLLPIPQNEITINSSLTQNPGY